MEDGCDFVCKPLIYPQVQWTCSNQDLEMNILDELYMHPFATSAL